MGKLKAVTELGVFRAEPVHQSARINNLLPTLGCQTCSETRGKKDLGVCGSVQSLGERLEWEKT
jgi:hypothetical protein